jgi:hypothetical protein
MLTGDAPVAAILCQPAKASRIILRTTWVLFEVSKCPMISEPRLSACERKTSA